MNSRFMKCFLMISALVGATVAHAEGVTLDSRFDNVSTSYSPAGTGTNTSSFQGARARLLFTSKINDDLSTKIRFNLLKANDTPNTEAKFSSYVDYAFVSHQLAPGYTLSAGKVIAAIGGREAIVNPGDYYFASMAGAEILARPLTALWPVGVTQTAAFGDQKLAIHAANTTTDDGAAQTRNMVGVSYIGSFMDKTLLPIVSFHRDAEQENTEKRDYAAAGLRYLMENMEMDLDYLSNTKSYKTWALSDNGETTSIVGSFRYKMNPNVHLLAKVDSSVAKTATAAGQSPTMTSTNYTQYGLTAEYYPYENTKFRYHFAVVQKDTKPENVDKTSEMKVMVGVRLVHDLLK